MGQPAIRLQSALMVSLFLLLSEPLPAEPPDDLSQELITIAGRSNYLNVYMDRFRALLRQGADLNAQEPNTGLTALHAAVLHGRLWSAEVLIENHASIDPRATWRSAEGAWNYPQLGGMEATPLQLACYLRQPEIVQRLLLAGADLQAVLADPVEADLFQGWGIDRTANRDSLMLFLGDGPRAYWPKTSFEYAEYRPWYRPISKALATLAATTPPGTTGETALVEAYAAMFESLANEAMRQADAMLVREKTVFTETPGETDIPVMLVASGVDLNRRDQRGLSAYEHAADDQRLGVLAYLLAKNHSPASLTRLSVHLQRKIAQTEARPGKIDKDNGRHNSPEAHLLWAWANAEDGLEERLAGFQWAAYYIAATLVNHYAASKQGASPLT